MFGIIVRGGTVGTRGRPPSQARKLSVAERQDIEEKIQSSREMLGNESEQKHLIQDRGRISVQLRRMEAVVHQDDSLVARGAEKDRVISEIKVLDAQIAEHVPPANIQRTSPKDVNAFEKAVEASMHALSPEVTRVCERRQDLARRLEPNDPLAGSLKAVVGD